MNGYTLEQKIDICLRYISADTAEDCFAARDEAIKALRSETILSVEDTITDLFNEIGMPPHQMGYICAAHALQLVYSDRSYLDQMNKRLYTDVAKRIKPEYDTRSVERRIRHSIETTFNRGNLDRIQELFGGTVNVNKGKLTNREFLAFCERELRRRMRRVGVA